MPLYVTPGLYYETVDTAQEDIDPSRVDIPAFLGFANQGPVHQSLQINSQAQFQAIFGGFIPNSYLAYTVRAFFENGGRAAMWCVSRQIQRKRHMESCGTQQVSP